MSNIETILLASYSSESTFRIGSSFAASLYQKPLTIFLRGDLGAGKTTFVQGLGLGLPTSLPFKELRGAGRLHITSPTYALENRYGETLLHLDLFRIDPKEAHTLVESSEDFPGIRVIEWSDRLFSSSEQSATKRVERLLASALLDAASLEENIVISFSELSPTTREIGITFADLPLPDRAQIESWRSEVHLPEHVARHCDAVGAFAKQLGEELLRRGVVVRIEALRCAGELHDLLRFVDFRKKLPPYLRGVYPEILEKDQAVWNELGKTYPSPHEEACARFLEDHGYRALATIIRPHGLSTIDHPEELRTIEQKLLFYSDKRIRFDQIVSLDERFEDFMKRYGEGQESEQANRWREKTRQLEEELFGDDVP